MIVTPQLEIEINREITHLTDWLKQNAPHVFDEQTHLDKGTEEQAYWHYGYLTALKEIQKTIHEGQ